MSTNATPAWHGIRALVFDVPQLQGNHQLLTDVRTLDGPEDVFDILDAEALATLGVGVPSHVSQTSMVEAVANRKRRERVGSLGMPDRVVHERVFVDLEVIIDWQCVYVNSLLKTGLGVLRKAGPWGCTCPGPSRTAG